MNSFECNSLDIASIHPKKGHKYSPNLYRWLTTNGSTHRSWLSRVYKSGDGSLWIGHLDQDGWLSGVRLMAVLCVGEKAATMSYRIGVHTELSGLIEVPDFWPKYMEQGRCAIDPAHKEVFVGDETRWSMGPGGESRSCRWCGQMTQRLRKWTEPVERSAWDPDAGHHELQCAGKGA